MLVGLPPKSYCNNDWLIDTKEATELKVEDIFFFHKRPLIYEFCVVSSAVESESLLQADYKAKLSVSLVYCKVAKWNLFMKFGRRQ